MKRMARKSRPQRSLTVLLSRSPPPVDTPPSAATEHSVDTVSGSLTTRSLNDLTPLHRAPISASVPTTPLIASTPSMTSLLRFPGKRRTNQPRRLVFKDGSCNVTARGVDDRKRRYLADLFTTIIDLQWRWHFFMFAAAFVASWVAFAMVWWMIAAVNGDLRTAPVEGLDDEDDGVRESCVANVYDFQTALLFSIETQHTIGYGSRYTESTCGVAIGMTMFQAGVGVLIQCLITGIVFSKLSRPKSRAQTIVFSRSAVICQRDRQYCLLFRVGDMQRSHIVGTSLRAVVVRNRLTREGELIPLCQYPIEIEKETAPPPVGTGSSSDDPDSVSDTYLFLVWPVAVVHKINERSPFWDLSAEKLLDERFEIIVILEGTVETTGKLTQVRTSYLSNEIIWGHRMTPLDTAFRRSNGLCEIDCTAFHSTTPVDGMPTCSAREFSEKSSLSSSSTAVGRIKLQTRRGSVESLETDCIEVAQEHEGNDVLPPTLTMSVDRLPTGKTFEVFPVEEITEGT